jgi:hypothetical protein
VSCTTVAYNSAELLIIIVQRWLPKISSSVYETLSSSPLSKNPLCTAREAVCMVLRVKSHFSKNSLASVFLPDVQVGRGILSEGLNGAWTLKFSKCTAAQKLSGFNSRMYLH